MSNVYNLKLAIKRKNDEFYTRYSDIEEEVSHYKKQLEGKTIYCNCDNPLKSNFAKYFQDNFDNLKLSKLIVTGLPGIKYVKSSSQEYYEQMVDDGDFRSSECIELLKESDVIITNPPFSLFREYLKLLVDSDKKFLVLGNQNAPIYNIINKMLVEKKFWFGYHRGKLVFDSSEGKKTFGNIRWFTNLEVSHTKFLELTCKYSPEAYKKYDNYDAINVDRVKDIPCDYFGPMGVPITFLDKYNPEQFEILGKTGGDLLKTKVYQPQTQHGGGRWHSSNKNERFGSSCYSREAS